MSTAVTTRVEPDLDEAVEGAKRRALAVGLTATAVVGVLVAVLLLVTVGAVLAAIGTVVVLLAGAVGWSLWVGSGFANAESEVCSRLGVEVGPDELPTLHNALEGVAILTGVQVPRVRLIDDDAANAMVACGEGTSTVVVTSGLLRGAGAVEAEALAASLLCRVRDGSARCATLAAGLPGPLVAAAGLGPEELATSLGEQRAVRADAEAVSVTRYPPGLIAALERMSRQGTRPTDVPVSTAALLIAPAVGAPEGVDESIDRTVNQPIEYRVAVLSEL